MFHLLARKPVGTIYLNCASTNITTSAWVQLIASIPLAATGIEIFNPSDAKIQLSFGPAGSETLAQYLVPYTIIPGGSTGVLPVEVPCKTRLSVQAIDQNVTGDYFVINFFA